MKLTPQQQHAKDRLRRARDAQRTARSAFEAEMEIAWRERSAQTTQAVLEAVQEAVRLGVPKTQIGQAYGTKDYNTIKAIIDQVTTAAKKHVEQIVDVYLRRHNEFIISLRNFDDWTDPENVEALTGSVTYLKDSVSGEWIPEEFNDLSRAVERELWHTSPLRTEVEKVVPLDTVPEVDEDDDEDDDEGREANPSWIF